MVQPYSTCAHIVDIMMMVMMVLVCDLNTNIGEWNDLSLKQKWVGGDLFLKPKHPLNFFFGPGRGEFGGLCPFLAIRSRALGAPFFSLEHPLRLKWHQTEKVKNGFAHGHNFRGVLHRRDPQTKCRVWPTLCLSGGTVYYSPKQS